MKVKSESEIAQSCLTLSDPMDYILPGSSIHGIFQARVLEWSAIAFSICRALSYKCDPVVENSPPDAENMVVIPDWGTKTPQGTRRLNLLAATKESSHTTTKSLNRQNRRKKMSV